MDYSHYRRSTLGNALQDTLDDMLEKGSLTPALAQKIFQSYDKSVNKTIPQKVRAAVYFRARRLESYRFCDNVWTLLLRDVQFFENLEFGRVDKLKIVACDGTRRKMYHNAATSDQTKYWKP